MIWKGALCLSLLLLARAVSSSRPGKMLTINLNGEANLFRSWPILSAGAFMVVALVLSFYLIFEHLAIYNQPEVYAFHPFIYFHQVSRGVAFACVPACLCMSKMHMCACFFRFWSVILVILCPITPLSCVDSFYIISGAEIFDWSCSNGSCICTWVGK